MSENKSNLFKDLTSKIKNNKLLQYLLIVLLFIVVVFVLFYDPSDTTKSEANSNSVDEYVNSMEDRLSNLLSQVEGAGKVSVIISVESGMQKILAMETVTKETGNHKEIIESPVIVNGKTVTLRELYPKINGVIIVAEGAKNIGVLSKIQQATRSLLNIDLDKIEILSMK